MAKSKTLEEAYKECEYGGLFQDQEVISYDKIKTTLEISETNTTIAKQVAKGLDKKSLGWSVVYKLFYDALMEVADALVRLNKKKIPNHQCLFAYICTYYPELDLSWEFFEKIRTKRNGLNYYGTPIKYEEFKEVELQMFLYIKTLTEAVGSKLTKLKY